MSTPLLPSEEPATPPSLRELAERAQSLTECSGWSVEEIDDDRNHSFRVLTNDLPMPWQIADVWRDIDTDDTGEATARFIAAANPAAILALLAELESTRAEREQARDALSAHCDACDEVNRLRSALREAQEAYCGAIANLGPIGGTLRCGKAPHGRHVMHFDADRLVTFDNSAIDAAASVKP